MFNLCAFCLHFNKINRGCKNFAGRFYYVSCDYENKKQQIHIIDFAKKLLVAYFEVEIGNQDKSYVSQRILGNGRQRRKLLKLHCPCHEESGKIMQMIVVYQHRFLDITPKICNW